MKTAISPATLMPLLLGMSLGCRVEQSAHAFSQHDLGEPLGSFSLSYYWLALETSGAGPKRMLRTKTCAPIKRVSVAFARTAAMEGSGRLKDGRLVTAAGSCRCSSSPCFRVERDAGRWGVGVEERRLVPFRSIAVDPSVVSIGTTVYVRELDGARMPGRAPWGDFVHDGCLVADDRGGGVRGQKIDLFVAEKQHYRDYFRQLGLEEVTLFTKPSHCARVPRATAQSEND